MTTTPDGRLALKSAVDSALEQLRTAYGEDRVLAVGDGQGGAWVELADVELSGTYVQSTTFVVFLLPFNLPGADIYPMFVRDDLTRRDDAPLGDGLQRTTLSWPANRRSARSSRSRAARAAGPSPLKQQRRRSRRYWSGYGPGNERRHRTADRGR